MNGLNCIELPIFEGGSVLLPLSCCLIAGRIRKIRGSDLIKILSDQNNGPSDNFYQIRS